MPSQHVSELERSHFDQVWSNLNTQIRIEDQLQILQLDSRRGKRILVCSCGSGILPVRAANAGAEVYAVDISEIGIQNAIAVAKYCWERFWWQCVCLAARSSRSKTKRLHGGAAKNRG